MVFITHANAKNEYTICSTELFLSNFKLHLHLSQVLLFCQTYLTEIVKVIKQWTAFTQQVLKYVMQEKLKKILQVAMNCKIKHNSKKQKSIWKGNSTHWNIWNLIKTVEAGLISGCHGSQRYLCSTQYSNLLQSVSAVHNCLNMRQWSVAAGFKPSTGHCSSKPSGGLNI